MAMTTLEQFNEEVKKELSNEIESWEGRDTKGCFDKFITQKLTEHKALILKMVREKMLKDSRLDALAIDNIEDDLDELGRIF